MKSNIAQLKIAEKYLNESCPKCCSMRNNCCCYFVSKIFKAAGNGSLFYNGVTVTYCPNAIKWCKTQLAQIPPYLAMPSDIIFFDWNGNNTPDHIGFVDHRISDQEIATLEGNTTSKYVVARRVRTAKYVQGIFRPHFKPTSFNANKMLDVDGQFGYNSIAVMQKWLKVKVDGILGKDTVKALQKKLGVSQDGSWGKGTSKAVQKMVGTDADGEFGEKSVKALQKYLNRQVFGKADKTPTTKPQSPTEASDGKLTVDGHIGKKTIIRMQEFFGTMKDGIISGQKEALYKYCPSFNKEQIRFCDGGSACIVKLQEWLGVKADGVIGEDTVKAWQKKLGVEADGCFGEKSAKAWQKYLNEHDKPTKTNKEKLVDKARELAWKKGTDKSKYAWVGGSATEAFKKAFDKAYPNRKSWGKAPKAGCCCDVAIGTIVRASGLDADFPRGFDEQLKHSNKNFQKLIYKNVTPYSVSQDGDIILYYKKADGSSKHVLMRGDGYIYEAQYEKTYLHVNTGVKKKLDVKRPYVVIFRAK